MNLILQGLTANRADIDRLARIAQTSHIVELNANAYRCEDAVCTPEIKAEIDAACLSAKLDYAFVAPDLKLSNFKLLTMDMDSTLITIECIDEIADMQGLKPQVAEITEAAMRGEIEFRESLTRRVALLKGLDASALARVYDERLKLSPGAKKMLAGVKTAGIKTLLVSGGFTFFTDRIKSRLGLDYTHSNVLEIIDGKLTGKVVGSIVDADEKQATVERISAELGATPKQAIVMGDGANDLKMMKIAGMSVAFRAKPIVRAQADIALNFVGLDGILNLFS
ncbi:MAG: phosphoserine phosphatase SerB [Burkholderiales bacterium]|nr:phosphoserine phosphatase SerB [Burkholderiales bacterium]